MILVASGAVFGVMWLLMRSMVPRQPKHRRSMALTKTGVDLDTDAGPSSRPMRNSRKNARRKKSRARESGLLELKEPPVSKVLPADGERLAEIKAEKDKQAKLKSDDESKAEGKGYVGGSPKASSPKEADSASIQKDGEVALPDLPSLDTLTGEEQEMPEEKIDLMSVFETDDTEDSATSDLAANLFDVDIANIEKLGNEVSQFLNNMH